MSNELKSMAELVELFGRWARSIFALISALIVVCFFLACSDELRAGDGIQFPWCAHGYSGHGQSSHGHSGSDAPPAAVSPPHLTLPRNAPPTATLMLQQELPPKSGYAYGWFGSNPAPQWGRHFGYSRNFTQWTER